MEGEYSGFPRTNSSKYTPETSRVVVAIAIPRLVEEVYDMYDKA